MNLTIFKIARIIGVLLLITAVALLIINPQAENNLPEGFYTPIVAFEFIKSKQEIINFFKVENPLAYEQKMLLGNAVDYLFMFLYSGLLFCIALYIKKVTNAKTMYLALFFCVLMVACDALENYQIYQLVIKRNIDLDRINPINSFPLYEVHLSLLNLFTWLKWSALASTFLLFSPFFLKGKIFHKIIGAICIICFCLCIAAFFNHGILNEIFASSVVLVFLLLAIFVFTYKKYPITEIN